jgi:hypothetical protein
MTTKTLFAVALAAAVSTPALAGSYQSAPTSSETAFTHFYKGDAAVTHKHGQRGLTITVSPLPDDNGRPAFAVEVDDDSDPTFNFGLDDIAVTVDGQPAHILTKKELAKKAAHAAYWAAFGAALAADLANTNYSTTTTSGSVGRRNFYASSSTVSTNNAAALADESRMDADINARLGARLADARDNVIDLTTIGIGGHYGGKIVLDKPRAKTWPAPVTVAVLGEAFQFMMTK